MCGTSFPILLPVFVPDVVLFVLCKGLLVDFSSGRKASGHVLIDS